MPTSKEILKEKFARLNDVPNDFLNAVEKSQREIFDKIFAKMNKIKLDEFGNIELSLDNFALVDELGKDLDKIISSDKSKYSKALEDFNEEFKKQKIINDNFYKSTNDNFENKKIYDEIYKNSQQQATETLSKAAVTNNVNAFKDMLQTSIGSASNYNKVVQNIRNLIEGSDQIDGKMLSYAKQNAKDLFAVADRQHTKAISEDLGYEFYEYTGGLIDTSREFCQERVDKVFHKKEIESWADKEWAGKASGTDKSSIFTLCGGYNCDHVLVPVPIEDVPEDVLQDAIDRGWIEENQDNDSE